MLVNTMHSSIPDKSQPALGRSSDGVGIQFKHRFVKFPPGLLISPCSEYHLKKNSWTYVDGNGCGSSNSRCQLFVLGIVNRILGIDLSPVCNIHDMEYQLNELERDGDGCLKTHAHKILVDGYLRVNIIYFCRHHDIPYSRIRLVSAMYQLAVLMFGSKYYWKDIPLDARI